MKSTATRARAEDMFVREGRTLQEIAEHAGVSKTTAARWSKDGGWVEKRKRRLAENPQAGLEKLCETRRRMLENWPDDPEPGQVDALHKLDLIIVREEERVGGPGPALRVMEDFAAYVARTRDADAAALIARSVEDYLGEVRKRTRP